MVGNLPDVTEGHPMVRRPGKVSLAPIPLSAARRERCVWTAPVSSGCRRVGTGSVEINDGGAGRSGGVLEEIGAPAANQTRDL